MKLVSLLIFIYSLPLYAQDECEFKLYVDSLYGFSIEIPAQQNFERSKSNRTFLGKKHDQLKYTFFVRSKGDFIDHHVKWYSSRLNFESNDSLLVISKLRCRFSLASEGDRAESYGRIDSLIQFTNDNGIRIIEFHRTQVFEVFDGSIKYEKSGPLFFVILNNLKGEFVFECDFNRHVSEKDHHDARKIVSSIKVLE